MMTVTLPDVREYQAVHDAMRYLAGMDSDHATVWNGVGFSGQDTNYGHVLAETPLADWSPKMLEVAWKIARKYRATQLAPAGITLDHLTPPPVATWEMKQAWIEARRPKDAAPTRMLEIAAPRMYNPTVVPQVAIFRSEYNPTLVADIKALPNRRYHPDDKSWEAPIAFENVGRILEIASIYNFAITDAAKTLLENIQGGFAAIIAESKAHDAELEVAGLGGVLRPFQKADVAYIANATAGGAGVVLGNEMGLGKTISALATVQYLDAFPLLVVCPANLKWTWSAEATKWLPGRTVTIVSGRTAKDGMPIPSADVVIVNYDIVKDRKDELLAMGFGALVFDEGHMLRNTGTQRWKAATELSTGLNAVTMVLTGTPIANEPADVVNLLRITRRFETDFGGWKRFNYAYTWTTNPHALRDLHAKMRATCYRRVRKLPLYDKDGTVVEEGVLTELPEKQRVRVFFELDNIGEYNHIRADLIDAVYQRHLHDVAFAASLTDLTAEEQDEARRRRAEDKAEKAARAEVLVKLAELRQASMRGKIKSVIRWAEGFLADSDEKLVLFTWHQEAKNALVKALAAYNPLTLAKGPAQLMDRFHTDPTARVAVLNIREGGVGLTLSPVDGSPFGASNVAFVEYDWTPLAIDQATDRVHRIGQRDAVTAWDLCGVLPESGHGVDQSVDIEMLTLLEAKREVSMAITDGTQYEKLNVVTELLARYLERGKGNA